MSHLIETCAKLTRFDKSSISPDSPWEGNLVREREVLAKTMTKHFAASGGPYVLSVSSAWGTGKSDFLERWDKWLQQNPAPKLCFRFNAWEHDFTEDPFLAFATALNKFISDNPPSIWIGLENAAKGVARALAEAGKRVIFPIAKKAVGKIVENCSSASGFDPQGAAIAGGTAEAGVTIIETSTQELLDKLKKAGTSRADVTENLRALGYAAQTKSGAPLIVMVDELDRCKPSFAVALLEAIKHLFCVPGVVFVLAIEAKQLSNCISKTYGLDEAGALAYLHKFIDMDIALPAMNMHTFLCQGFEKTTFALGFSECQAQVSFNDGSEPAFLLPKWIAAVIHDLLPSPREALQVMNQVSVLSFRPDMDFISLLACAYAMSYRAKNYASIDDSVNAALNHYDLVDIRNIEPRSRDIIQYRNLFSGLMKSRSTHENEDAQYDWRLLFGREGSNTPTYLVDSGEALWNSFPGIYKFGNFRPLMTEGKYFSWRIPCGLAWREYLVNCLYFIDQSGEE